MQILAKIVLVKEVLNMIRDFCFDEKLFLFQIFLIKCCDDMSGKVVLVRVEPLIWIHRIGLLLLSIFWFNTTEHSVYFIAPFTFFSTYFLVFATPLRSSYMTLKLVLAY